MLSRVTRGYCEGSWRSHFFSCFIYLSSSCFNDFTAWFSGERLFTAQSMKTHCLGTENHTLLCRPTEETAAAPLQTWQGATYIFTPHSFSDMSPLNRWSEVTMQGPSYFPAHEKHSVSSMYHPRCCASWWGSFSDLGVYSLTHNKLSGL